MVTKIIKRLLDNQPPASQWGIMARGLGKSLNEELFALSSPSRASPRHLDWTGMLFSRKLHIQDRPADWYYRSVILPIHKADLVLVVSNVPSHCLQVNARRALYGTPNENKWHTVDQKGTLRVDRDRGVHEYSIDLTADGQTGVLAVMPDNDPDGEGEPMTGDDETIHIFDTGTMEELKVFHTGYRKYGQSGWVSTVEIDPSGDSLAVWQ